jgi:hypothetical protein
MTSHGLRQCSHLRPPLWPPNVPLEPENTPPPAAADALTRITIRQLYVFLWKLFAAALLFSLPFLLIFLIIAAIAH